ncbi:MAG: hypothetical protein V4805_00620 [Pseudomonadota bacterium]
MTNIYQAPGSNLSENTTTFEGMGSLENGIAGNYKFSIQDIISEAWAKTNGSKGTVWMAVLLYMVIIIPVGLVVGFVLGLVGLGADPTGSMTRNIIAQLLSSLLQLGVSMPLAAGFWMIAIKLAVRAPTQGTEILAYFKKIGPLVITGLLMYALIIVGFILLVLPGIYLSLAYSLAPALVAEKNLSPWEALEASRKAITHRWFSMFGLYLVLMIIAVIAAIPLGIGLIWVLPLMVLAGGIVYRNIFGFEGAVRS